MSARFINVDRDTPMLLPPDLRDWIAADDPVHFVIEAVMGMHLTTLKVNTRGSGSAQYPPRMMLALLIYCYAHGIFSSRKIERATYRDVAVRFLAGNTHPDHDTIAKFRRENFDTIGEAFKQLLLLAEQMGVLKVGTVSIDGTHLRASASKNRNVRYDRAAELEKQLEMDIADLLAKAEQADASDDDDDSLPEEIRRRTNLREKMRAARAELERRAKERAAQQMPEYERKVADHEARGKRGSAPKVPDDTPPDSEQVNLTDAHSRLMRKNNRGGYEQCYNAQATVDADGSMLILSGHVSQCSCDANELIAGVRGVPEELGAVSAALADCGFVNIAAMKELEAELDLYVAVGRPHQERRYDFRPRSALDKPPKPVTDPCLLKMREKLQTLEGKAKYNKRKQTVEPVFGIIKSVMAFRQFYLRGIEKVSGEWSLVNLAYNFKRLANLRPA